MLPRGEREAKQRDKGEFQVNIKKLFTLRKWCINNHSVYEHLPLNKTHRFSCFKGEGMKMNESISFPLISFAALCRGVC